MTPEQKARVSMDALLLAAGWHVCSMADANIHLARGVAIREFPLNTGYGFADYLLHIDGKAAGVIEAEKEGATLIAHQDYGLRGRVQVVETPHALLLTNVGGFLPGRVETVIDQDAPLEIYRNPYLAEAMVCLNLIVALVRAHQPVSREDIDKLLLDKLPEVLSHEQKLNRVHKLLRQLAEVGFWGSISRAESIKGNQRDSGR